MPPESQGDTESVVEYMYNQLDTEYDYYDFDNVFNHYFNNDVLFSKVWYVGNTPGEENILDVLFGILNIYGPIELSRYIKSYVVEASIQKVT